MPPPPLRYSPPPPRPAPPTDAANDVPPSPGSNTTRTNTPSAPTPTTTANVVANPSSNSALAQNIAIGASVAAFAVVLAVAAVLFVRYRRRSRGAAAAAAKAPSGHGDGTGQAFVGNFETTYSTYTPSTYPPPLPVQYYQQHAGATYTHAQGHQEAVPPHASVAVRYAGDGVAFGRTPRRPPAADGHMVTMHTYDVTRSSAKFGAPPVGALQHTTDASLHAASTCGSSAADAGPRNLVDALARPDLAAMGERLEDALDALIDAGEPFLGLYALNSHLDRCHGGQGLVQFVRGVYDDQEYAIKFFLVRNAFECERALYANQELRDMMPAICDICANDDGAIHSTGPAGGFVFPPCIIVEKGESLDEWALQASPDFPTSLQVLCHVVERLRRLHAAGLAHRDLKPGNVLWRPKHKQWTLIDFGCAARVGQRADLSFSLVYAPPEVVEAFETGQRSMVATTAQDMWALGVMAFELLTRTRAFPPGEQTTQEIINAIAGRAPLPWEGEDTTERLRPLGLLRRSILLCLKRDPAQRPSAGRLLNTWNKLFETTTAQTYQTMSSVGGSLGESQM